MTSHNVFGRVRGVARSSLAVAALAVSAGCTDFAGYDLDYIMGRVSFLSTMRTTVSFEAQTLPLLPPPGAVPVSSPVGEHIPVFAAAALDSAAATLTNPLQPTADVLARGEAVYATQCFACHGAGGAGNGPVVGPGKFPMGPALNGGTAVGRSDGYIYAVIRVGRGLMPPYGDRVTHNDRWAVVHYIRQLQQQAGAVAPAVTPPAGAVPGAAAAPGQTGTTGQ